MRDKTLEIMASFEGRLNRLINKKVGACGFDEAVMDAQRYRERLENWLAGEIEKLCEEAGVE